MSDDEATVTMIGGAAADSSTAELDSRYLTDFERRYRKKPQKRGIREHCRQWIQKSCSKTAIKKAFLGNFPFLKILRGYSLLRDLPNDVIAGMTVGIMQIPQGMAYAELASLPPICGLYTSLFGPLIYFFFGSSKHASMGTIAVVSLMIAAVLDTRLAVDDVTSESVLNVTFNGTLTEVDMERAINARKIQIATALSFISGLIMMLLGKIGLGFVTTYMSEYLISGFTTGVAAHVVTSQMKNILGLRIKRFNGIFKIIKTWIEIFSNITDTNWVPVVTSVVSMIIIYVIKTQVNERFKSKLRIPLPIELVVVIVATIISHFANFESSFDVKVVGEIPAGIPHPKIPDVGLVTSHIVDAVIIGVIAFAQSVSMAKTLALKNKYSVDSNQEMFAYGIGSVLCSIFSGYITAASVARSAVQDGAGGITQIASLAAIVVVLVVVVAVGPLFYSLPTCVLSSVILVNLRSMFRQTLQLPILWRKSKWDFSIWIATFLCVTVLDADIGLGIGIIFSVLTVVCRTQRSGFVSKGKVDSTQQYRSHKRYDQVHFPPHVKILTFESPLYFANSELFVNKSYLVAGVNPIKIKRNRTLTVTSHKKKKLEINIDETPNLENSKTENGVGKEMDFVVETEKNPDVNVQYLILDMSGVTFIDTMGEKALSLTVSEFESIDVQVFIVGLREEVLDILNTTDFLEKHKNHLFMNVHDALITVNTETTKL